jgi:hypothetical protein
MKYPRRIIKISLTLMMVVLAVGEVLAQAPPPSMNPPEAPLDGLVALLLTVGVGYGIYRSKGKSS